MPENGYQSGNRKLKSMIRVHDLSDGFKLVGSYDLPEDGPHRHVVQENGTEAAHLHKVQDKAVSLCR